MLKKICEKINKRDALNLLIMFVISIIILVPMFANAYRWNHDSPIHIANVVALTEQIKQNFFHPSKIVGLIANNFGYGTSLFYPPLAHDVVAYLNYFINNVGLSFHIIYLVSLFLSGLVMYFLSKRISKNTTIALYSGIIYMLFPYHLSDMYIRDNLSETLVFIFMPLIIRALYELYYGDKKKFYLFFVVGYVGGIFSHMTVMVYFTAVILMCILFRKDTWKNIIPFIMSSIFILLICSPFLCTVIEHKLNGTYAVFMDGVMSQKIWWTALWPHQYLNIFENYGNNQIKYFIDLVSIIMLVITFINYRKIKKNKFYMFILIFGIISFILTSTIFPWDWLPNSFRILQFAWRMESFVAIAVALIAPLCLTIMKNKKNYPFYTVLIIAMVLFAIPNLTFASDVLIDFNNLDYNAGMGWQYEYLPKNSYNNYYNYFDVREDDVEVKAGKGDITNFNDQVPNLSFDLNTKYGVTVEFPRLYYLGYQLKDDKGNSYNLYEDRYGFISADLTTSGSYTLTYTGTKIEHICDYASIISIIAFIGWRIYEKNKHSSSLL